MSIIEYLDSNEEISTENHASLKIPTLDFFKQISIKLIKKSGKKIPTKEDLINLSDFNGIMELQYMLYLNAILFPFLQNIGSKYNPEKLKENDLLLEIFTKEFTKLSFSREFIRSLHIDGHIQINKEKPEKNIAIDFGTTNTNVSIGLAIGTMFSVPIDNSLAIILNNTPTDVLSNILSDLSILYRLEGGSGLKFSIKGTEVSIEELIMVTA